MSKLPFSSYQILLLIAVWYCFFLEFVKKKIEKIMVYCDAFLVVFSILAVESFIIN